MRDHSSVVDQRLHAAFALVSDPNRRFLEMAGFDIDTSKVPPRLPHSGDNLIIVPEPHNIQVNGQGNTVIVNNVTMGLLRIRVSGDNNVVYISPSRKAKGTIVISGDDNLIVLCESTTCNQASFALTGSQKSIIVGNDCMLSHGIKVQASDMHPIYRIATGEHINAAKSVILHPHSWLAADVTVLKGVSIGAGSVVGSGSVVTKNVPSACLAIGTPARVIEEGITWLRNENRHEAQLAAVKELLAEHQATAE